MPATLPRPDDGERRQLEIGVILEKIRRGGNEALTPSERVLVVEIFRRAHTDKRLRKVREEISIAHLEYCFRLA